MSVLASTTFDLVDCHQNTIRGSQTVKKRIKDQFQVFFFKSVKMIQVFYCYIILEEYLP